MEKIYCGIFALLVFKPNIIFGIVSANVDFMYNHEIKLGQKLDPEKFNSYGAVEAYEFKITPTQVVLAEKIIFPNGEAMVRKSDGYSEDKNGYMTFEYISEPESAKSHLTDGEADLSINLRGNDVTGNIMASDGCTYKILNLNNNDKHAWIKTASDKKKFRDYAGSIPPPKDGPHGPLKDKALKSYIKNGSRDIKTEVHISIKVYYTQEALEESTNLMADIENAIGTANNGYQQSEVRIRLVLHCIEKYRGPAYDNSFRPMVNLQNFALHKCQECKSNTGGTFEQYRRVTGSADTAVLLMAAKNVSYDGISMLGKGNFGNLFSPVVLLNGFNSKGEFLFGQQISHLFGAGYEDFTKGRRPSKPYARGYLLPGTGKRTIMSHPTKDHPHQINYYSGPNTFDADGDRTGDKDHDNVRILNRNRFVYANLGDESQPCQEDMNNNNNNFDNEDQGDAKSSSSSQSSSRVIVNVPPSNQIPSKVNGNVTNININFYGNVSVTMVAKLDDDGDYEQEPELKMK